MLGIDINEFLPNETFTWISQQLERVNVDLPNLRGADLLEDGLRLHFRVYLTFREIVHAHYITNQEPAYWRPHRPFVDMKQLRNVKDIFQGFYRRTVDIEIRGRANKGVDIFARFSRF